MYFVLTVYTETQWAAKMFHVNFSFCTRLKQRRHCGTLHMLEDNDDDDVQFNT